MGGNNQDVNNVVVVQYVSMGEEEAHVKNVVVIQYVSMADNKHSVLIVMGLQYVNQKKNHIILDVGREDIENMVGFALIAMLIFFQMTLKQKTLERKVKS